MEKLSTEVWKGINKNFNSARGREEFLERKRRNDHMLEQEVRDEERQAEADDFQIQDAFAESLEPLVHDQIKRGEIQTRARKISFSSIPTFKS